MLISLSRIVAAFISETVGTDSLEVFLRKYKTAVEDRAKTLVRKLSGWRTATSVESRFFVYLLPSVLKCWCSGSGDGLMTKYTTCEDHSEVSILLVNAELIDNEGFAPCMWMIDKAAAERKAVLRGTGHLRLLRQSVDIRISVRGREHSCLPISYRQGDRESKLFRISEEGSDPNTSDRKKRHPSRLSSYPTLSRRNRSEAVGRLRNGV